MKNRLRITASIALAALAALSSCNDSYPGLNYDYGGDKITNNETYDKTPIMVFVNKQNFFSVSATRSGDGDSGSGPFVNGDDEKYSKSRFYIYAFRAKSDVGGMVELKSEPDLSVTRYADANTGNNENELHCLLDGADYNYGMPAYLTTDRVGSFDFDMTNIKDEAVYYSSKYQDVGYNFFSYYIDNLDAGGVDAATGNKLNNPHRDKDRVYYDLVIDGTQDIMCGRAPDLKADMFGTGKTYDVSLTTEEKNKVISIDGYSTFAAHRGVYPIVDMKHQLTQLNFKAYPGDEKCENIVITGITVHAVNTGILTVASRDKNKVGFTPSDNPPVGLQLREASENGEPCKPIDKESDKYRLKWDRSELFETVNGKEQLKNIFNRPSMKIGGSMMVPPAESYQIDLHFKQEIKDKDGNIIETKDNLKSSYTIKAPEGSANLAEDGTFKFMNGYKYDIHIAVYGLREIQMTANIDDWKNGGEIIINPDDPGYDIIYGE